jgi:hypothetical protein
MRVSKDRQRACHTAEEPTAKGQAALQEMWMAETKADAEAAFEGFIQSYRQKCAKAAEGLSKDLDTLLTRYEFPTDRANFAPFACAIGKTDELFATLRRCADQNQNARCWCRVQTK